MCQGSGRQCIYGISLASGWIRPMESLCGDQRKREKENSGPFSSSLCCLGQRLAASLLRLQLPPCSPRLGDPGSSCPARPPPGGPDRSMVTPTPLFTPAPPPRGGSIFLPGLIGYSLGRLTCPLRLLTSSIRRLTGSQCYPKGTRERCAWGGGHQRL